MRKKLHFTRALLRQPRSPHPGYKSITAAKIAASVMESRIEKPPLRIGYSVTSAIMHEAENEQQKKKN